MSDIKETKLCKHCQTEMPKTAKVCPQCRKKQGGIGKWIVIAVVAFLFIGIIGGGSDSEDSPSDDKPQNVGSVDNSQGTEKESQKSTESEETNNEFKVGDIVETSDFKISFISSSEWESDNMFVEPKDGYVFYKFEFEFENISKSDQYVSSADFECYADGYSMESSYYGDDILSITSLSSGKKVKGSIYFEIPENAESIILEYETNFWTENKIVFVIK